MIENKFENLKEYLKSLNGALVAYSSGVDSTFLLKTAKEALGKNVMAVTVNSPSFPERELIEAIEFCKKENIKHQIININPLEIKELENNPIERCYICKKEIFRKILEIAKNEKIENILEGSNFDDEKEYRPGKKALIELKIKSPLKEFKITKSEVRALSRKLHLETANKPSFACLLTRFPYNSPITEEKVKMVDNAEQFLYNKGFSQFRVRFHDYIARIEVMETEFQKILDFKKEITENFKKFGFKYTALDLSGYKTGSMDLDIKKPFQGS